MDGPFIFIGTHRIKEGKLDAFKEDAAALAELVEEQEPQLLAFNFFFNDDETEATIVQVHPDADSMLIHMGSRSSTSPRARRNSSKRRRSRSTDRRTTRCSG